MRRMLVAGARKVSLPVDQRSGPQVATAARGPAPGDAGPSPAGRAGCEAWPARDALGGDALRLGAGCAFHAPGRATRRYGFRWALR
eukprot:2511502-Pyramimonas_sp.AAC.1